jgi:hypothetical protein
MEERSRRQWKMEASTEGGQGLEGAIVPYVEWNSFAFINIHGVFRNNFAVTCYFTFTFNRLRYNAFPSYDQQPSIWTSVTGTATWSCRISHISSARN